MWVIVVLIWVFSPGELVMKNGKLMAYQGEYKIEDGYVKFTSKTGASLQIPVSAVDFEKTKERDNALSEKKPVADTRTRSDREFQAFIEDSPSKSISLAPKEKSMIPEPIDTLIVEVENEGADGVTWPSTLKAVNVYDLDEAWRRAYEKRSEELGRAIDSYSEAQKSQQLQELRRYYQYRYDELIRYREQLEDSIHQRDNSSDTGGEANGYDWMRERVASVNAEIRQLIDEALARGVVLDTR